MALAAPRAPCRVRAGPRLVVRLGQAAELGRGRGAEPAAAAKRGALCGQDALLPSAPPPRAGRAQILAGVVERRSPLAPGSVCLAGGVGTQVPAGGAELEVLTGPAGLGRGRGERRDLRGLPSRPRIRCARVGGWG